MGMRVELRLKGLALCGLLTLGCLACPSQPVAAQSLDLDGCDRLELERKALIVLNIDRYFEKGVEWAKDNLTVADLNLVKRYLDVYEQLKFRCQEDVALVGDDEDLEDEDDDGNGPIPPFPVRGERPSAAENAVNRQAKASREVPGPAEAQTGPENGSGRP